MGTSADEGYGRFVAERRSEVVGRIADAASRAGRDADEVTLVAVSKTVDVGEVVAAWQVGYRAFGENRPQELGRKLDGLRDRPEMAGVRFDMIGNLQKNKINQVIGRVHLIHSVSSAHLGEAVSKRSQVRGVVSRVLLEVNVSGEESKSGFSPEGVVEALDGLLGLPGIRIEGFMTMAPAHDPSAARATFSALRELRDRLSMTEGISLPVLSCGMSDDFEIAVEEGSTLVRLGRVVFDPDYDVE